MSNTPGDVGDGLLLLFVAPLLHPRLQLHQEVVEPHALAVDAYQNLWGEKLQYDEIKIREQGTTTKKEDKKTRKREREKTW